SPHERYDFLYLSLPILIWFLNSIELESYKKIVYFPIILNVLFLVFGVIIFINSYYQFSHYKQASELVGKYEKVIYTFEEINFPQKSLIYPIVCCEIVVVKNQNSKLPHKDYLYPFYLVDVDDINIKGLLKKDKIYFSKEFKIRYDSYFK
ncbi:MAG: hypothetical protein KDK36_16850, partial [Leptospiraceae bacterium]|nr:hypothetical protein [Leptospiraceae bacterium]